MLDFSQFEWLSFDCYGTLIDWESGILGYLRALLQQKGCERDDSEILQLYSEFEPREQAGEYRSYREVLASVVHDFGYELDCSFNETEAAGLAASIAAWKPFSDTVPALRSLQSRYKLAILSNIDDELFAWSEQKLGVPFDCVVTAQQAGSYKPSLRNFELLLDKLALPRSRLLHVAESLYHDIGPANAMGISSVWINRRQGRPAAASRLFDARPDFEVHNLTELADKVVPQT